jgi:hypothetical protein
MGDFDPTKVDWGRVYAEAIEIAIGFRARDPEDLVQQGMTLVLEGTAPFDEDGGMTLAAHLVDVALTQAQNRARIQRLRNKRGTNAKLQHWMDEEPPTPEELNHSRRLGDRAYDAVLAACDGDDEVRELVVLAREEDLDEAADQAERLGWGIERVRNARKRMTRIVGKVAASMEAWKEEGDP